MAIYSRKEFAELMGIAEKHIPTYHKRGKLIVDGKTIDSDNLLNAKFIAERKEFLKNKDIKENTPEAEPAVNENDDTEEDYTEPAPPEPRQKAKPNKKAVVPAKKPEKNLKEQNEQNLELFSIKVQIERLNLEKVTYETRLKKIESEKRSGEVIPVSLIAPVILQQKQGFLIAVKNEFDTFLREFAMIKELNPEEVAYMRGRIVMMANKVSDNTTAFALSKIDEIITKFSTQNGVGQRS